jgi:hypothetical protein
VTLRVQKTAVGKKASGNVILLREGDLLLKFLIIKE